MVKIIVTASFFVVLMMGGQVQAKLGSDNAQEVIKNCFGNLKMGKSNRYISIQIIKSGYELSARVVETPIYDGQKLMKMETTETVDVLEQNVRADLKGTIEQKIKDKTLNIAEILVNQAMFLSSDDPEVAGDYFSGVDLKKIRSTKMYVIGAKKQGISLTLIEAKNDVGEPLGSFLGGALLSSCNEHPPKSE